MINKIPNPKSSRLTAHLSLSHSRSPLISSSCALSSWFSLTSNSKALIFFSESTFLESSIHMTTWKPYIQFLNKKVPYTHTLSLSLAPQDPPGTHRLARSKSSWSKCKKINKKEDALLWVCCTRWRLMSWNDKWIWFISWFCCTLLLCK